MKKIKVINHKIKATDLEKRKKKSAKGYSGNNQQCD